MTQYAAVVIGGSAGGFQAAIRILSALPADFPLPLLLVEHLHASDQGAFAQHLSMLSPLPVVEAWDKAFIQAGHVYTAPANYHLLVERDGTLSLSIDERVNWSRPSIDILFESAALVWGAELIAVILSGANADGTQGLRAVKAAGGLTIAQQPADAETSFMPLAAIQAGVIDEVLNAADIGLRLVELATPHSKRH